MCMLTLHRVEGTEGRGGSCALRPFCYRGADFRILNTLSTSGAIVAVYALVGPGHACLSSLDRCGCVAIMVPICDMI